jgi:hypothetical protein
MESVPELIEITLGLLPEGRGEPIIESFIAIGAKGSETSSRTSEGNEGREGEPREETSSPEPGGSENNVDIVR